MRSDFSLNTHKYISKYYKLLLHQYYYVWSHIYSKSLDQPGKVANPARGQLYRKNNIFLSAFAPENLVSRDVFGSSPVLRRPAHLHTQPESGAYLRGSSQVPRRRPFIDLEPPDAIGSVPSLSGQAIIIAYRWRSLPRVRRHSASKPQGSFERVLPWQVTMDQLICASLSPHPLWVMSSTDDAWYILYCCNNTHKYICKY